MKFIKAVKTKDVDNLETSIETLKDKNFTEKLSGEQQDELLSAKDLLETLKENHVMKSIICYPNVIM